MPHTTHGRTRVQVFGLAADGRCRRVRAVTLAEAEMIVRSGVGVWNDTPGGVVIPDRGAPPTAAIMAATPRAGGTDVLDSGWLRHRPPITAGPAPAQGKPPSI